MNKHCNLSISNYDKSSGNSFPSEIGHLAQTNSLMNINGIEKNMVENETPSEDKTKLISEKQKENKYIFAGDFCSAWLDCFESIS